MIIKQKTFKPAPEGIHRAVCVDVFDMGELPSNWGPKHFVRLTWELECKMDSGKPFIINKRYTPSLSEKATLAKDLKSWRGRAFTAEELNGFDLEHVIGAPCMILVQHDEKDGSVYGNIKALTKATGEALKPSGEYIRMKDRPENEQGKKQSHSEGSQDDAGSDIPF